MDKLSAGQCRFCEQGTRLLVRCSHCGRVLAICDECDAMWLDPADESLPLFPHQPTLPCPHCGTSHGWEGWQPATDADLAGLGWNKVLRQRPSPNEQQSSQGDTEE